MSVSANPRCEPESPPLAPTAAATATAESSFEETRGWPVTRLPSWAMMLVLGLGVTGPAAIADAPRPGWLALLLPGIVAALSARAVFDTLSLSPDSSGAQSQLLAAVTAALVGVGLMAAAEAVVGVSTSVVVSALTAVLTAATLLAAGVLRDVEIRLRLSLRRVYFIGSPEARADLAREVSSHNDARMVGSAASGTGAAADRLVEAVLASRATVVVLDGDAMRIPELVDVASRLNLAGLRVRDLVSYYESEFKKVPLSELSPTWFLFDIASIHRRRPYRALRRGLELLLAAVLLVVSLPVILLAALATCLERSGPVLFRQRRVGKGGEEFTLLKLRTMRPAEAPVAAWAQSQAHRVTRVGAVLRRFRLDELPQLWNVLRGDLALIGPRPEQVPIVQRLDAELPFYGARHCIRPGVTGWAQVNLGYGGSNEGTVAKLQRDLYYIKHGSLRLDALILWLTFKAVMAGRG